MEVTAEDRVIIDRVDPIRRRSGFTLIEVILAIVILATVLTLAYRILHNILETERIVSRLSTPEKIGQGILSILRRDLLGVTHRHLGERVFQVYDNGEFERARDEIEYITTRNPIMPETLGGQFEGGASDAIGDEGIRSIVAVRWFLQETPGASEADILTLFRQENVEFEGVDPFASPTGNGVAFEIYDKVRGFSIECFDGYEWLPVWDSQTRLMAEAEEAEALAAEEAGGVGVSKPLEDSAGPGEPDEMMATTPTVLPPAAVPVAVRITITLLAGDEKGVYTDETGFGGLKEYTYSSVVPILTAMRIPLSSDEELAMLDEEMGEEGAMDEDEDGDGGDEEGDGAPTTRGGGRSGGGRRSHSGGGGAMRR